MTIGDVLAAIAAVALLGTGWAATLLLAALAFPERVRRAGEATVTAPGVCLARGAGLFLVVGVFALALGHQAAGPLRLVGYALWAGLGLAVALGSAGIVSILGARIREVGTEMPPFAALTWGAALYVLAGLLPIVGWFLVTPLALLLSLGGASAALRPATGASSLTPPELGAGGRTPSELGTGVVPQ